MAAIYVLNGTVYGTWLTIWLSALYLLTATHILLTTTRFFVSRQFASRKVDWGSLISIALNDSRNFLGV